MSRRGVGRGAGGVTSRRAGLLLVLAAFAAPAGRAAGQSDGGAWFGVSAGLGGGYFGGSDARSSEGLGAMAELSYRTGPHLISARGSLIAEILGDGLVDFGLLYGRSRDVGASHLSASAGLGLVLFENCPLGLATGLCRSDLALGVPLALRASWRPSRFFGLGVQALGSLGADRSSFAGMLFVEAGRLR